ncbi:GTP-binding protein [Candidatus Kryptobacter tengchongensis]|uniref:GTPase Der n=1 Tax=Kryptobacter tengchongensis TaxID=1643429 RepID=A0A916LI14_KRYT1|nr:ribosome biogenesis GTPase Der [Candidatus Kryptobacter tengchongensis]CUS95935.1 GTP-binding protein [Candidatus Kryptobacter tengchongensis]CUS96391.1 GTP-binding protein [Candidatus Kryptobacter tengchongensis]CUU05398.1 GTP-binding protein [Candidatus Kryptobacter tengchongensis]
MGKNIVAIVGRPNVGKSTLFNRIIGERDAIVDPKSGVTRDRHYGQAEWNGKKFTVIDTGGYVPDSDDVFESAIREQVQIAIDEADVIVFVVDAITGVTPIDIEIAKILRQTKKKVILAVNKIDNDKLELYSSQFYELGLGEPFSISALHGRKVGDFLDEVVKDLPEKVEETEEGKNQIKVAVVGQPNVGKSSFVNAILGENRIIVTDIPGTTRDSIDTTFRYNDTEFVLIDTAGLRRRSKIKESIEFYSAIRALKSVERCDVAVVMLDATCGLERQDLRIIGEAADLKKGIIIAVNKWDLIEKDSNTALEYEHALKERLKVFDYVPILFISAKTKQRIFKVLDLAKIVYDERNKKIKTSELNKVLFPIVKETPPPAVSGKEIKIKYVTQVKTAPPVFAFFANFPDDIPEHYKRFLENKIREHFGFIGVPVTIVFKKK